jgi:hypothetical protein
MGNWYARCFVILRAQLGPALAGRWVAGEVFSCQDQLHPKRERSKRLWTSLDVAGNGVEVGRLAIELAI